jgi:hypothetical protein
MSHTAILALMQNQSFINQTNILENMNQCALYLKNLLSEVCTKYEATFGNNHWLAIILFLIIIIQIRRVTYYADHLKQLEEEIQYLKKKTRYQDGNLEYIFDYKVNNELKLTKLANKIKKLQKDVKEYV